MFPQIIALLLQISFVFNIFFAAAVIFSERRNPAVTWAWLMVVFLIPYFGFILYMSIGMEGRKYRVFAGKCRQDARMLTDIAAKKFPGLDYLQEDSRNHIVTNFKHMKHTQHITDLLHLNIVSAGGYLTQNNAASILGDGDAKFSNLFQDIKNAKSYIHIQYYIFRNDTLGRRLVDALAEKAREGVEVKLLIDGMGNFWTSKGIFKPLVQAGGHFGIFMPPRFFRINFQNHRKLCVIDGKIGYIGGFNVGDEYMGRVRRFGAWRDLHMRLQGDIVKELELRFIMDWNFAAPRLKVEALERYFPSSAAHIGDNTGSFIQIITGGPDTKWANIFNGFSKMISEANENIYIQTPYFAPDENIFESLRIAALSGIDVRIIIPANPDHPFVKWCSLSYLGELLEAGVRCYEYTEGFIHSKLVIIDGIATSVGTANMDMRSFKLNFEINAFIYDTKINKRLKAQFYHDLKLCREILAEVYQHRSVWQKIKEAFSRLLSPLL